MNKLFYPCRIKNIDGVFYANFINFEDCFTDGRTFEEAYNNAKDVLEGMVYSYLKYNKPLPDAVFTSEQGNIVYVDVCVGLIQDKVNNQAVKKTLTIPKWLNDLGEEQSANFSAILQKGLKDYLNVK